MRGRSREGEASAPRVLARLLTRGSSRARFEPFFSVHRWPRSCEPPGERPSSGSPARGPVGRAGEAPPRRADTCCCWCCSLRCCCRISLRAEPFLQRRGRALKWGRGFLNGRESWVGGGRETPPPFLSGRAETGGDLQGCADFAKLPQESPAGRVCGRNGGVAQGWAKWIRGFPPSHPCLPAPFGWDRPGYPRNPVAIGKARSEQQAPT